MFKDLKLLSERAGPRHSTTLDSSLITFHRSSAVSSDRTGPEPDVTSHRACPPLAHSASHGAASAPVAVPRGRKVLCHDLFLDAHLGARAHATSELEGRLALPLSIAPGACTRAHDHPRTPTSSSTWSLTATQRLHVKRNAMFQHCIEKEHHAACSHRRPVIQ